MMDAIPEALADDSGFNYTVFDNLIRRLKLEGVNESQLTKIADENNLENCSYGSFSRLYPLSGAIWGMGLGLGLAYISNALLIDHLPLMQRSVVSGFGYASTLVAMFRGSQICQEEEDYLFFNVLKKRFGPKEE